MRGVVRKEKDEAFQMLRCGMLPTQVAKELNIPTSTILTWYTEIKRKRTRNDEEIKSKLKENATCISIAEARIMAAASKVVDPDITDEKWFSFQRVITSELQKLIILNT